MVALHVNKLGTGQTVCTVHHNVGVWTETIVGGLRDGKTYARWQVEPSIEVRLRCLDGAMIAETHDRATGQTHLVKPTPSPWVYGPR